MKRVTRTEFARQIGVNRSTITRWIESGRISAPGPDGRLDLDQALREREATESPLARDQARKAQFDEAKAARQAQPAPEDRHQAAQDALESALATIPVPTHTLPTADAPEARKTPQNDNQEGGPSLEQLGKGIKLENYRLTKARAELANLDLDRQAGLLVERTEVDFVMADIGNTFRGYLEGLPDRLAPVIAGHRGDLGSLHKLISDAAREILDQIADHLRRRAETL